MQKIMKSLDKDFFLKFRWSFVFEKIKIYHVYLNLVNLIIARSLFFMRENKSKVWNKIFTWNTSNLSSMCICTRLIPNWACPKFVLKTKVDMKEFFICCTLIIHSCSIQI